MKSLSPKGTGSAGKVRQKVLHRLGRLDVLQKTGIDKVLTGLLGRRKFTFSVERAVFLTVLHRLFCAGSDRAAARWKANYRIKGVEDEYESFRQVGCFEV